jgi:glutathione S-transferase
MSRVRIVGSYLSPYVRKVLVVLGLKGIDYEIDPIVPFFGDDRFARLSPLRRIPVLVDGELALSDSSVICQYLEDRYPEPTVYPTDIADRARARWLEEFADTRLGDVLIWRLFNQLVIRRFVWDEETDRALVERTLAEDVPQVLDYLESLAPADGFCFGAVSIADVAIASFFRNAQLARFTIDAARWPRAAAFVARVLAHDAFQRLAPFEQRSMRTPIPQVRSALAELGAPLTAETWATAAPRRGVMPIA